MAETYSTYEAKAKFSEVLRKVRAGKRVVIAYRGREVAEIRPLSPDGEPGDFARRLERLEEEGTVSRHRKPIGALRAIARRPGALARFLETRD